MRELYEETGLNVELTGLLAVDTVERRSGCWRSIAGARFRYACCTEPWDRRHRGEVNGSTDDVAWVPRTRYPG